MAPNGATGRSFGKKGQRTVSTPADGGEQQDHHRGGLDVVGGLLGPEDHARALRGRLDRDRPRRPGRAAARRRPAGAAARPSPAARTPPPRPRPPGAPRPAPAPAARRGRSRAPAPAPCVRPPSRRACSSKKASTVARKLSTSGIWLMAWRRLPAVRQAVGVPAGELAQLVEGERASARARPPSGSGSRTRSRRSARVGSVTPLPAIRAAIWRKIHGLRVAPRPTMTPSQPVSASMRRASSGSRTSPLPITGIDSVSLSRARCDQSASPENIWRAVRACMATAWRRRSPRRSAPAPGSCAGSRRGRGGT